MEPTEANNTIYIHEHTLARQPSEYHIKFLYSQLGMPLVNGVSFEPDYDHYIFTHGWIWRDGCRFLKISWEEKKPKKKKGKNNGQ